MIEKDVIESQALWRGVLLQAFIDLKSQSRKSIAKTYKAKASMWFSLSNQEFLKVCDYAGYEPKFIYNIALKIKNEPKTHSF